MYNEDSFLSIIKRFTTGYANFSIILRTFLQIIWVMSTMRYKSNFKAMELQYNTYQCDEMLAPSSFNFCGGWIQV